MTATTTRVEIQPVKNGRDLRTFIGFQWKVYAHDPNWVPPLFFERLEFLNPKKNPFFGHAEGEYFLAKRGEEVVGTIAAFVNRRHNEFHGENIAFFGFFEVLEDYEAAETLLETARRWARERGYTALRGPAQFSTNEECGLLVDGFDSPPMILYTYNPRYYQDYIERAGFVKAHDLWDWYMDIGNFGGDMKRAALPPKVTRVREKVLARGEYTTRMIDMSHYADEVAWVKDVYNSAWEKNWGFVPMDEHEFDHLAASLKSIIDPPLVQIVEYEGKQAGFGLTLPDVNYFLRRIHPGPSVLSSYLAGARLMLNKRRPPGLRVFALGITEPYRGTGVDALLYSETFYQALAAGYTYGEGGWVVESNLMMNRAMEFFGARKHKTYRYYEKSTA